MLNGEVREKCILDILFTKNKNCCEHCLIKCRKCGKNAN